MNSTETKLPQKIPLKIRKVMLILLLALLGVFTIQNLTFMELSFFTKAFRAPKALVIVAFFALGAVFGWLARWIKKR